MNRFEKFNPREFLANLMFQSKKKQEEQDMAFLGVPMSALNTNSATTTTIYPTQGGITTVMGTLGSGSAGVSTAYLQAMAQNQQGHAYANAYGVAYALPPPTGTILTINFIDMRGMNVALAIDAAYIQIMQDISNNHQYMAHPAHNYSPNPISPQPHLKMLEGDFSEEEMTEAEGIIAELEGTHGEAPPLSRP